MIKSFSVRPKPSNNNAKIVFGVTLGASAVLFLLYFLMDRYRGFVGTIALFVLVTAILIYTKFVSPSFCYDVIADPGESPLFVVRQFTGKRVSTLCRIDLADVTEIKHETRIEMREHKTPDGYKKYVYAPTMMPSEIYRLTVCSRYEKAEIIIEISSELADLLNEIVSEARALFIDADEE